MSTMQVALWQHYNVNGEFLGQSEEHPTSQRRVLDSDVIVGFVSEADALAAIKAKQDRIDTLNSSLDCEKRMRKDSDERAENAEAAIRAARVQALEEAARLYDHEDVQAPVGNSAWGEAYQEGWISGAQAFRDAIRLLGEDAGRGESAHSAHIKTNMMDGSIRCECGALLAAAAEQGGGR